MQAVILAAGIGSRLGSLTKDIPKCLLDLGGVRVIDYQINVLRSVSKLDFDKIFIVTGYKAEKLYYLKDFGINIIYNPKYKDYNNIYSFYIVKDYISEDFLLFNGDVIFHPYILKRVIDVDRGTFFVIDNVKELGEEEMKVIIDKKDNRIIKFGKDITPEKADGEYIGIARFNLNDARAIFDVMNHLINNGETNIWYELAINHVLDNIVAKPVFTGGMPWIEIDTPEDYKSAQKLFKEKLEKVYRDVISFY